MKDTSEKWKEGPTMKILKSKHSGKKENNENEAKNK